MIRQYGRNAFVITLLTVLLSAALQWPIATRASAAPSERTAALIRVTQIKFRRTSLEPQLTQLKSALATKRAVSNSLLARLNAPENSLADGPQQRAKLLDQTAASLEGVVVLTSKLYSKIAEDSALESELGAIVAKAQADVATAALDRTQRGVLLAHNAREYLTLLKTRAEALSPRAAEAKLARTEDKLAQLHTQKSEAEHTIARFRVEPRFANVTETVSSPTTKPASGATLKTCRVRDIDWKNVTITVAGESLRLENGSGTIEAPNTPRVNVTVKQVDLIDSNLDTREEALVLIERDDRSGTLTKRATNKSDVLYVFENVLDCSLRQLARVTLSNQANGHGSPARGGYDYTAPEGTHTYRWSEGLLREVGSQPTAEQAAR